MGPVEIVIIVIASAIVASAAIVYAVRRIKGKPTGCSGCSGCPYAGSCGHKTVQSCAEHVAELIEGDKRDRSESDGKKCDCNDADDCK